MTKRYIQNCTGDSCATEDGLKKKSGFSGAISRIIFYFLLANFVVVSVYVLFFSASLQIIRIEVEGNKELDRSELERVVQNSLEGEFLGLISRNNFLFISQGRIEKLLEDNFKRIRSVKITKTFPDSVIVRIDERKALLVWCGGNSCFLIDESGVAYSEADFESSEVKQNNLLQVLEKGGQQVELGQKVIEPAYENYVLSVKDELKKLGYEVEGQFWTPSRMADELNLKTTQGPEFYFSTNFSLDSALRNLAVILEKEIPEEKRAELAYLDLRNESKIFYKFKSLEPEKAEEEKIQEDMEK